MAMKMVAVVIVMAVEVVVVVVVVACSLPSAWAAGCPWRRRAPATSNLRRGGGEERAMNARRYLELEARACALRAPSSPSQ